MKKCKPIIFPSRCRRRAEELWENTISGQLFKMDNSHYYQLTNDDDEYVQLAAFQEIHKLYSGRSILIKYKLNKIREVFNHPGNSEFEDQFIHYGSIEIMEKEIINSLSKSIVICCLNEDIGEIIEFCYQWLQKIEGSLIILVLNAQNKQEDIKQEDFKLEDIKLEEKHKNLKQIIKLAQSYQDLEKMISRIKEQFNQVPSFSVIEKDHTKNLKKYLPITWMLYPQNRNQAYKDFETFVKGSHIANTLSKLNKIYSIDHMSELFPKLIFERKPQLLFNWYTAETYLYKVVNIGLRLFENSSQFAYLRFIFAQLYRSIHQLHLQQLHNKLNQQGFTCYRGMTLTNKQTLILKKSVNKYLLTEGFMSTSLSHAKAKRFGTDTFIIKIPPYRFHPEWLFAYADIKQFSNYKRQEEILFNPFCCFKITDIEIEFSKGENHHRVTLQLVQMESIMRTQQNDKETKNVCNFFTTAKLLSKRVYNQGSLMISSNEKYEAFEWSKRYLFSLCSKAPVQQQMVSYINKPKVRALGDILKRFYADYLKKQSTEWDWYNMSQYIIAQEIQGNIEIIEIIASSLAMRRLQQSVTLYGILVEVLRVQRNNSSEVYHEQINTKLIKTIFEIVKVSKKSIEKSELIREMEESYDKLKFPIPLLYLYILFYKAKDLIASKQFLEGLEYLLKLKSLVQGLIIEDSNNLSLIEIKTKNLLELHQLFNKIGRYRQSADAISQCEVVCEQLSKRDSEIYLSTINYIGCFYLHEQKNRKSIAYFKTAFIYFTRWSLTEDIFFGTLTFNLGYAHFKQNELEQAIQFFRESLRIFKNSKSEESEQILTGYSYLAEAYLRSKMMYWALSNLLMKFEIEKKYCLIDIETDLKLADLLLCLCESDHQRVMEYFRGQIDKWSFHRLSLLQLQKKMKVIADLSKEPQHQLKRGILLMYMEKLTEKQKQMKSMGNKINQPLSPISVKTNKTLNQPDQKVNKKVQQFYTKINQPSQTFMQSQQIRQIWSIKNSQSFTTLIEYCKRASQSRTNDKEALIMNMIKQISIHKTRILSILNLIDHYVSTHQRNLNTMLICGFVSIMICDDFLKHQKQISTILGKLKKALETRKELEEMTKVRGLVGGYLQFFKLQSNFLILTNNTFEFSKLRPLVQDILSSIKVILQLYTCKFPEGFPYSQRILEKLLKLLDQKVLEEAVYMMKVEKSFYTQIKKLYTDISARKEEHKLPNMK